MKFLKILWGKWLSFAHVIGNFQSQVIMSIFYLVFFAPIGVLYKLFSDPLKLKKKSFRQTSFQAWEHPDDDIDSARKPF